MRKLKQYLLFTALYLTAITGSGNPADSMKGVAVSFELLDKHGNPVVQLPHGQSATFRIELINTTPDRIRLTYTPPGYEISVYAAGGGETPLWTAHHEMAFIQALEEYVISAGETRTLEHEWDLRDLEGHPLPPGRYEARARLNIGLTGELEPLGFTIK